MKKKCSSETSVDFKQTTLHCISEDRTLMINRNWATFSILLWFRKLSKKKKTSSNDQEVHIFHSCAKVMNPTRDKKRRREGRKYKILIMQTLVRELYTFVVSGFFFCFGGVSFWCVIAIASHFGRERILCNSPSDQFPVLLTSTASVLQLSHTSRRRSTSVIHFHSKPRILLDNNQVWFSVPWTMFSQQAVLWTMECKHGVERWERNWSWLISRQYPGICPEKMKGVADYLSG
jgi:hypothetical protein